MSGSLTMLVVGDSGAGAEVATLLTAYADSGMLQPFLLVRLRGNDDARSVTAQLVGSGPVTEMNLLEAVASRDFQLLRLVRLKVLDEPLEDDAESDGIAASLAVRLADGYQTLVRINLVVPVDHRNLPPAVFRPVWEANVVVSPEDRVTERQTTAPVAGRLAAHAAVAAATAGALWLQMADGAFDALRPEQGSEAQSVQVMRAWVRVLTGGGALQDVVRGIFGLREADPAAVARAAGCVPARDGDMIVDAATTAFIAGADGERLGYQRYVSQPPPPPRPIGLLAALGLMFRFIWSGMRGMPAQVLDAGVRESQRRLERIVQDATFGTDSMMVATFGGRSRVADDAGSVPVTDPSTQARQAAQRLLAITRTRAVPPATPHVWRDLRAVAFGLHDGGPLPSYVPAPLNGPAREVAIHPQQIAAAPSDPPATLASLLPARMRAMTAATTPLRECDPLQIAALQSWIAAEREAAEREAADEAERAGAGDSTEATSEAAVTTDLEPAETFLRRWVEARSSTLGWRLAAHLATQVQVAGDSFNSSVGALMGTSDGDDESQQARALRRLKWRWAGIAVVCVVALVLWGLAGPLAVASLAVLSSWWIAVGAVAFGAVGIFVTFLRYQRELFRISYRRQSATRALLAALACAEHDAAELVRLTSLYDQARDWGELIGWMLHRPQGPEAPNAVAVKASPVPAQPLAMTTSSGRATPASLQRVASVVGARQYHQGWLSELYAHYSEAVYAELAYSRGLDAASSAYDADSDLADPKRRDIATAIRTGRVTGDWRRRVEEAARQHLSATDPAELFPRVVITSPRDEGTEMSASEFFDDLLPTAAAAAGSATVFAEHLDRTAVFDQQHRVAHVHLWLPEGTRRNASGATVRVHELRLDARTDDAFQLQGVRVDVAGPITIVDLSPPIPTQETGHQSVAAEDETGPW